MSCSTPLLPPLFFCNTLHMYIDSAEPAPGSAGKFVVVTEHVVPLYGPLFPMTHLHQQYLVMRHSNALSVIDPPAKQIHRAGRVSQAEPKQHPASSRTLGTVRSVLAFLTAPSCHVMLLCRYSVFRTLNFLNKDCNMTHGHLSRASVFVTDAGNRHRHICRL